MRRHGHIAGNTGEENPSIGRQRMQNETGLHTRVKSLTRKHDAFFESLLSERMFRRQWASRQRRLGRSSRLGRAQFFLLRAGASPKARCTVDKRPSNDTGFSMKSKAPNLVAVTAV